MLEPPAARRGRVIQFAVQPRSSMAVSDAMNVAVGSVARPGATRSPLLTVSGSTGPLGGPACDKGVAIGKGYETARDLRRAADDPQPCEPRRTGHARSRSTRRAAPLPIT